MTFLIFSLGQIVQNITHSRHVVQLLIWVPVTTTRRVLRLRREQTVSRHWRVATNRSDSSESVILQFGNQASPVSQ